MNARRIVPLFLVVLALGIATYVFVSRDTNPAPPVKAAFSSVSHGQRAYEHTAAILAFGPRPPESEALTKVQAYVAETLDSYGWASTFQAFEADTPAGPKTFINLKARYRGKTTEEEMNARIPKAILSAHIDSMLMPGKRFLGADDAASAVAAILEIARVLAENDPKLAAKLELVFFDGEESIGPSITPTDGLYGSKAYAQTWRTRDTKPRFGIVLDMIGHRDLRIRIPSDTPSHLRDALMAAAKANDALDHFGIARGPIIDDHVPLNQAGIPTMDVIGDFTRANWWHTESDNLELISPESLDISIAVTLGALKQLLP